MSKQPRKNARKVPAVQVRLGAMSPEEFKDAGSTALGGRGWQKAFARGTGFSQSTVTRYLQGTFPIPQHVAVMIEMLATLRRHGLPVPEAFSAEQSGDDD